MNTIDESEAKLFAQQSPLAESDQFAIYATAESSFVLVQRHEGTEWVALRLSGDAVFRIGALLIEAMRYLYRNVAGNLSPINRERGTSPDSFAHATMESHAAS